MRNDTVSEKHDTGGNRGLLRQKTDPNEGESDINRSSRSSRVCNRRLVQRLMLDMFILMLM